MKGDFVVSSAFSLLLVLFIAKVIKYSISLKKERKQKKAP